MKNTGKLLVKWLKVGSNGRKKTWLILTLECVTFVTLVTLQGAYQRKVSIPRADAISWNGIKEIAEKYYSE